MENKEIPAVSNEEIITALLASRTKGDAAKAAGLSETTFYKRLQTPECQMLYADAKAELLRLAVEQIRDKLTIAVDTITNIMQDDSINAAVRLQAAQTLLNALPKYSEALTAADAVSSNQFALHGKRI